MEDVAKEYIFTFDLIMLMKMVNEHKKAKRKNMTVRKNTQVAEEVVNGLENMKYVQTQVEVIEIRLRRNNVKLKTI